MSRTMPRSLAMFVIAVSFISAGCSSSSKSTSAAGASSVTSMASAATGAASLYSSLGGSKGVNALASSFGANLSANKAVSSVLSAADIVTAQQGLVNSIAAASGQKLAAGSTDLLGALSGKNLDAGAVAGVGQALTDAGTSHGLKPDQMAALASLWLPIGQSLLGGK